MDGIRTAAENKIAREFFKNFNNTTTVSKELYPKSFKPKLKEENEELDLKSLEFNPDKKKKNTRRKNVGVVSSNLSRWYKLGYIDTELISIKKKNTKGTEYRQKIDAFRLNINLIIDYLRNKKLTFNPQEKKVLISLFQDRDIRQLILDWNKKDNKDENNKEKYNKSLTETMISFIRSLWCYDEEVMLFYVFGDDSKKYEFLIERIMKFLQKNKMFYKIIEKIERKYELAPLLIRKHN